MASKTLQPKSNLLLEELNQTLNKKRSKSDPKVYESCRALDQPDSSSKRLSIQVDDKSNQRQSFSSEQKSHEHSWKVPPAYKKMIPVPVKSGVKKNLSNQVSLPTVMLPLKDTVTLSIITTKPPVSPKPKLSLDSRMDGHAANCDQLGMNSSKSTENLTHSLDSDSSSLDANRSPADTQGSPKRVRNFVHKAPIPTPQSKNNGICTQGDKSIAKPVVPAINLPEPTENTEQNNGPPSPIHMCGLEWKPDDSAKINVLRIMWFHPSLTRHQAEAELTNSEEGVYLLRPRVEAGKTVNGYSLDVRSSHSVKHYKIDVEEGDFVLGDHRFRDFESFQQHFTNHPILGDSEGNKVVCQHPYPREVDELHEYYFLSSHFIPTQTRKKNIVTSVPKTFSLASKEGYLFKVGQRVKSWKKRWFVLKEDVVQYFATKDDAEPIKQILLKDVLEVNSCEIPGKLNTFQIMCPDRTFYIMAPSPANKDEWLEILQFKLDEIKQSRSASLCPCSSKVTNT